MPVYDHNYQARMAMAEQIGETRAKVGVALSHLIHSPEAKGLGSVQRAIALLQEIEAGLMELRREPKWTPEELEERALASVRRVQALAQEDGQ